MKVLFVYLLIIYSISAISGTAIADGDVTVGYTGAPAPFSEVSTDRTEELKIKMKELEYGIKNLPGIRSGETYSDIVQNSFYRLEKITEWTAVVVEYIELTVKDPLQREQNIKSFRGTLSREEKTHAETLKWAESKYQH